MNQLISLMALLLLGVSASAQTKPAITTPPSVVSVIEGVSGKRFLPDTAYAALSDEDEALIAKEPLANWGLLQESSPYMSYSNLVIGTRSYQLLIAKSPKEEFPVATLMRYTTPKSKPEPIVRGTLKPKTDDKAKE